MPARFASISRARPASRAPRTRIAAIVPVSADRAVAVSSPAPCAIKERSSQRSLPVLISATRQRSLSSLSKRKAVSTCASATASDGPEGVRLTTRTAPDGNSPPPTRLIRLRASFAPSSPLAQAYPVAADSETAHAKMKSAARLSKLGFFLCALTSRFEGARVRPVRRLARLTLERIADTLHFSL